jgi:hypothetical protein
LTPRRARTQRAARFIPFAAHEAADYLFGAGLIVFAVHASAGMVPVLEGAGGAWCLLGVLTKGPLGLLRLLGRRVHAIGDVLIAVALGIAPLIVHHNLDWIAAVFAEAVVLVQLRIATWTAYDGPVTQFRPAAAVPGAPASASPTSPAPPPTDERILRVARLAGRSAGVARRGSAKVGPTVDGAAHRLGRAAGAARRVGSRAAARRQPPG